jgi:hypothetical protein
MDLMTKLHLLVMMMAAKTTRTKKWDMTMRAETKMMMTPSVGLEDPVDHHTAFQLH